MSWALFLGCTVPVRNLNYEAAVRKTAAGLGLELADLPGFGCCGFPLKSLSSEQALVLTVRNLALAQADGRDVVAVCSACAATLSEAEHVMSRDPDLAARVNERLAEIGLSYRGGVKVRHYTRLIHEEIGPERIREAVVRPLDGGRFAPHYGCHYLKPAEAMDHFDSPEDPRSLTVLIEALGAEAVEYPGLKDCCGGGVLGTDEDLAQRMAFGKLERIDQMGLTGLVVICPFCNVMFEGQQKTMAKKFGSKIKVPLFFYPQLLGLALGFTPEELGFKHNRIKDKDFLKAFEPAKG
ncbi:MAG: CoB--CoM heterodisulfide reductase iron-sulfur subunit B family protein [Proteobacteria bacterium]|nr:CoB--CoM heterodisulfide reductase iron-sulfur subunit B family protein [Pseudomonadota bacterium]